MNAGDCGRQKGREKEKGNGTRQGNLSTHLKGYRKSHQLQKDRNVLFLKKMYTSVRLGPQSSASEGALPETLETDISELGEKACQSTVIRCWGEESGQ